MKAKVDHDICIGCGLCVGISPEVFRMEGDKAVALVEDVQDDMLDIAGRAAEQCPVNAISIS
ncbi:MAG: ferredoxin [Candidatus Omnitrophica bacterium]|nr:ferredoxin [Candidatus Omnitrophota bacterium]MDD5487546.1 ferredoxin [Candidatus Omnitrophota bacterium]